jgi:hypothetical protein
MCDGAKYLRPVIDGLQTRTLFVGNAGPAVGLAEAEIIALCEPYRVRHCDVPDPAKAFVFLTFDSIDDASACKEHLSGYLSFGRQLNVKYACRHPKFKVQRLITFAAQCLIFQGNHNA